MPLLFHKINRNLKIVFIAGAVAMFAAALVLFYTYDPAHSIWAPKCPFYMLTGWKCPGCGSSRAVHCFLNLHILEGFGYNPILAIGLPYVAVLMWLQYFRGRYRFPKLHNALTGSRAIYIIMVIIVVYWVGRNII